MKTPKKRTGGAKAPDAPQTVWISIRGKQTSYEAGQDESIEMITGGTLYRDTDGIRLTYDEDDLSGLGKTQTTLMVQHGCVTMLRSGDVTSQMVFERGRKHVSYYDTEHGVLTVGVNTNHMRCDITDAHVDLEMSYTLEIDHAIAGANVISIHASEGLGSASDPELMPGRAGEFLLH